MRSFIENSMLVVYVVIIVVLVMRLTDYSVDSNGTAFEKIGSSNV